MIHPFTLHPAIYWIGGLAVLALAGSTYQTGAEIEKAKLAAFEQPQPEVVRLEGFDPNLHLGFENEVTLTAQIDLDQIHLIAEPHGLRPERRRVAPLYDTRIEEKPPTVDAVMLAPADGFDVAKLQALSEKNGALGLVATLNGRLIDPGPFEMIVVDTLAGDDQVVSPDTIYLEPFLDGRAAFFAPDDRRGQRAVAIGVLGLLIIAYGFLWRWIRRRFLR